MAARIRYFPQVELADCGAACLAMVLDHFGHAVSLDDVRDATRTSTDGTDALSLVETARWYGLRARGVRAELDDLRMLPIGTVLFWSLSHFVVLERADRRGVTIVDPSIGRCTVPWAEADRAFSGVAILLEPGEHFEAGGRRRRRVWRHVRPILRRKAALRRVVVTSLLLRLVALAVPLLTAALVDRVVPHDDRRLLTVIGVCVVAMVGAQFASSWIRGRLLAELRTLADEDTTLGFLEHLVALPYLFLLRRSPGDLMMRLRSNSVVRELLTNGALSALLDGSFVSIYAVVLFVVSPPLALLITGLAALQVVVLVLARRRTQRLAAEGLQAEAKTQGQAFQIFAGIGTLKASGSESRAVEGFANLFTEELRVSLARGRLSALVDAAMGALRLFAPIAVLSAGGVLVLDGTLSLGTALAVNALAAGLLDPLGALVSTGLSLQLLTSYLDRLNDILDAPREQEGREVTRAHRLGGAISARQVSFRYGTPLVVDSVDLDVAAGSTVAIVGRSGSGKTTLAQLLVGLYEPESGVVAHDGVDLRTLDTRSVRAQLGVVTQEPYLFGVSIRSNIAYNDPTIDLERVRSAAAQAQIAPEIEALPMAYDTVLADGGASLSGGQRQRIALARALATEPRVLLLDEATSHLDAITEAAVFEALGRLGCTTIVVAHRLSTVAGADLIVVLDGGRVVEQGRHRTLVRARGHYADLVRAQGGR